MTTTPAPDQTADDAAGPTVDRTTPPDAGMPTRVWLVAVLTVLAVEAVRMSGPLLDRAFAVGTLVVGAVAVATYVAAGLVAGVLLLSARRGTGLPDARTLLTGTVTLALARLVVQGLDGGARYVAGLVLVALAVGVLTLGVAFVAGRRGGGREAAVGLLVGCGLSTGLQLLLGTWDAVWRDGWVGWLVAAVLALAPVVTARALRAHPDTSPEPTGRPRRLWALGPFVALAATLLANPAFAASQSGTALGVAGLVLALGDGAAAWLLLRPQPWSPAERVAASVLLVLATAGAMFRDGTVALVSLVLLAVAAALVLSGALSAHRPAPRGVPRTAGATAAVGLGVVGPLLLYMLDYDVPLPADNAWVMVVAAVVVAVTGLRRRTPLPGGAAPTGGAALPGGALTHDRPLPDGPAARSGRAVPGGRPLSGRSPARAGDPANAVRLLVLPGTALALVGLLPSTTGADVPARAAADTLIVVDWNLHYGVSPLTAVDLEGIARTIAAQDPDVVTLQEVERGWVFGGGTDVATWLAHRLGMTVAFAPAADRQFGNAVLARSALTDVAVHPLPYGAGPQARSALSATLTTADGTAVRITSVHLQHRAENTPTRLDQLAELVDAEPVTGPSVLAGDLNATPGSPELALLAEAGWTSAIDEAGDPDARTSPSTHPAQRIDWVLGQGVTFEEADVPTRPRQSDHLPVVARFTPQD